MKTQRLHLLVLVVVLVTSILLSTVASVRAFEDNSAYANNEDLAQPMSASLECTRYCPGE